MYQFYQISPFDVNIAVKSKRDIVTKMRELEWNGRSTNSDYMHVIAHRIKYLFPAIRFYEEDEFIEDLISYGLIKKMGVLRFVSHSLKIKNKYYDVKRVVSEDN